jgi:hypothetical protein
VGFVCALCGENHEGPLLDIRLSLPDAVFALSESERASKARVADDWCLLADDERTRYFVRGLLQIPVDELQDRFAYGVWVELTESDYRRVGELWDDPRGFEAAPFAGVLANELEPYPRTSGLPVTLGLRDLDVLPEVVVAEPTHRLAAEQRLGVSAARAEALAHAR